MVLSFSTVILIPLYAIPKKNTSKTHTSFRRAMSELIIIGLEKSVFEAVHKR